MISFPPSLVDFQASTVEKYSATLSFIKLLRIDHCWQEQFIFRPLIRRFQLTFIKIIILTVTLKSTSEIFFHISKFLISDFQETYFQNIFFCSCGSSVGRAFWKWSLITLIGREMFWRGKTPVRKNLTQVLQGGCWREKIQKMSSLGHLGEELLQIFTPWCQSHLAKMLKFSTKCTNSCQNVQIPHIGKENVIIIPCRELLMRKKSKKKFLTRPSL